MIYQACAVNIFWIDRIVIVADISGKLIAVQMVLALVRRQSRIVALPGSMVLRQPVHGHFHGPQHEAHYIP